MFFVLLNVPNHKPMALLDDDTEELLYFDTELKARQAATSTWVGERFGYEVFELGCGVQL
jgi:hypothetical protein